jgi:hypothetical protein
VSKPNSEAELSVAESNHKGRRGGGKGRREKFLALSFDVDGFKQALVFRSYSVFKSFWFCQDCAESCAQNVSGLERQAGEINLDDGVVASINALPSLSGCARVGFGRQHRMQIAIAAQLMLTGSISRFLGDRMVPQCISELRELATPQPFEVKRTALWIKPYFPVLHRSRPDYRVQLVPVGPSNLVHRNRVREKTQPFNLPIDDAQRSNLYVPASQNNVRGKRNRLRGNVLHQFPANIAIGRASIKQRHRRLAFDFNLLNYATHRTSLRALESNLISHSFIVNVT